MLLERWSDCRIVHRGCLFVYSNCTVTSSEIDIICAFYGGTWTSVSTVKVSYTCGAARKSNKSVKYFSVLHGNHALAKYVRPSMQQVPIFGDYWQQNQLSSLSTSDQISADSFALRKKVSVPNFFGQKNNYETWKAASENI